MSAPFSATSVSSGLNVPDPALTGEALVTRFAPSPTGYLHRGHAFSALTAARAAQAAGGRFLLRMEDIDTQRCRPEYEAAIFEDLAWLGLTWETPVLRQSEHMARYKEGLSALEGKGVIYPCRRTRREILEGLGRAPQTGDTADEPLSEEADRPAALRLSIDAAERVLGRFDGLAFEDNGARFPADPRAWGDIVLGRKDVGVSYHLAVVMDDAFQGVTDVFRGEDLFHATHIHRLLQALLDLPTPKYHHHRLLLRSDGKRFAKRDTAETLRDIKARGTAPEDLRAQLGL